jgi:hypothetical protein
VQLKIGIEDGMEGRCIAWALEYPGCFAYGSDQTEALMRMPRAFLAYANWIASFSPDSLLAALGDFDLRLVEVWKSYTIDEKYEPAMDGYEVNAWFRYDWKPLTRAEIEHGRHLLARSRADLLEAVAGLDDAALDQTRPGERWSLRGILAHVGGAEWWYLDRLDLARLNRQELPNDVFEHLKVVRQCLDQALAELDGVERVIGKNGEFWSPRKLLRRALWHELDHVDHIRKLRAD